MKHWQKHRLVAMFLLIATFFGSIPFVTTSVSAADTGTSLTGAGEAIEDTYGGRTLDEILDLISNMSYNDYTQKWKNEGYTFAPSQNNRTYSALDVLVPSPDKENEKGEVVIDPETGEQFTTSDYSTDFSATADADLEDWGIKKGDTVNGVYTPGSGKTTFKIEVPADGMYSIDILYYPVANYDLNGDGIAEQLSTKTTIERMFFIDGALPFNECRYLYIPRSWEYVGTDGTRELTREGEPVRSSYENDADYQAAYNEWLTATGGAGNYLWDKDIQNNDIRPDRLESPMWRTYFLRDWLGYTVEPFQFYLTEGTHYFTFEATREPLVISKIKIYGYEGEVSYKEYLESHGGEDAAYKGDNVYMVEMESPVKVSDQVLFPATDRTSCINSPSHPSDLVYNLATASVVGQYMTYEVYVEEAGLYNIIARFRQNTMAGMFTSRRIRINGEIPFAEASYLQFNYKTTFQNQLLGGSNDRDAEESEECDYLFYFEQGWNTIELEVVLGDMAEYVYDIANVINSMSNAYQKILTITGSVPDAYTSYNFERLIPDVIEDLGKCRDKLDEIYNELVEITGATGQHIVTLDTIRELIETMYEDPEYEIAPNFLQFKNYLTALSNWLYTSLSQPLKIDYLRIQGAETKVPRSSANFFYALAYEAKAFVASFFKDYNIIGFADDKDADSYEGVIQMWNTTSREDALILRTMIDSGFTPNSKIAVNIKYVAMGLQESILAGIGPDVSLMASGTAVSWGLRNAVEELSRVYTQEDADKGKIPEGKKVGDEVYSGFRELCPVYTQEDVDNSNGEIAADQVGEFVVPVYDESTGRFNVQFSHAALEAVSLNDATYLLPCKMDFEMAFYRVDVFADNDIKPPRTWQELRKILPQLINEHLSMGMQTSLAGYQMILYQMGGTLYADDYKRFNDDTTAQAAFDTLCSLFTDYSLPISGVDATRFRTGELPVYVANWTTYNTFMGYYELRGMWTMESLIGYEHYDKDTGEYIYTDRSSILNVEGIVIPRGSDNPQHVWEYMKWYAGEDAQTRLARQQLATANNTTVKYNSANLNALMNQAWTDDEKSAMLEQIPFLKGIPFNPGDYNISRYIGFAFVAAYNSNANPTDTLMTYIVDIDKELSRKREEYHLPFIDYYARGDEAKEETN